ncbi:acyl-CoA N-acyltransferase [Trametopsis cervina]|nr:acyl-CoA N-acyltransferase [Trametopsis cervina]
MAFTNSYIADTPGDLTAYSNFGPDPYDIHFCIPLDFATLETDRVKLVPFIPRLYAQAYLEHTLQHRALNEWYSAKPPSSLGEMLYLLETLRADPTYVPFAIIDKGRPDAAHPEWEGSFAGFIALTNVSAQNLAAEVGSVRIFPAFQRTYVTSTAVALLLRYCLEVPGAKPVSGLGLRRVQWGATKGHEASINAALRMGFKREGIIRWHKVVYNEDKEGPEPRAGDPMPEKRRSDTEMFSFCADNWEDGGREKVLALMERRV